MEAEDEALMHAKLSVEQSHSQRHFHHGVDLSKKSGILGTLANNLKQYIGAGILGLPYAFSHVGVVAALIVLVLVAFLSDHCIKLLLKAKTRLMEAEHLTIHTYGDIMNFCYGRIGQYVVNALMVFSLAGACVVYLIFISTNLHEYFPQIEVKYWVLLVCLPLIVISWFPSVKYLAPLSALATVAVICGVIAFMGYSFNAVFEEKEYVYFRFEQIPYFFAIALFTFEGILMVITLETSMKEPSKFYIVENISYVILTILFTIFGLIGYLAYGNNTNEVVTLNLPAGSKLSVAITACLCFSLFVSHSLFSRALFELFESWILIPISYSSKTMKILHVLKIFSIRLLCILFTAIIAIIVPSFGSVLGVIGAISGSCFALILPALFDIRIFFDTMSLFAYVKDVMIIALGVMVGILGFLTSIKVI